MLSAMPEQSSTTPASTSRQRSSSSSRWRLSEAASCRTCSRSDSRVSRRLSVNLKASSSRYPAVAASAPILRMAIESTTTAPGPLSTTSVMELRARWSRSPKQLCRIAAWVSSEISAAPIKPSRTSAVGLEMASLYSPSMKTSFRQMHLHFRSARSCQMSSRMLGVTPIALRNVPKWSRMKAKKRLKSTKMVEIRNSQNHTVAETGAKSYISSN
mmetsp:Transcript_53244/g.115089  ORF Transcript_53244/g.115089 Transcript_53244/m.115089 type:complete len:214 (-) Transcript_53244:1422-2063(-)